VARQETLRNRRSHPLPRIPGKHFAAHTKRSLQGLRNQRSHTSRPTQEPQPAPTSGRL